MEESSARKGSCSNIDLINDLPNDVQDSILSYLPIQDAVRTSILSRKWRHSWTRIPRIIFQYKLFSGILNNKFSLRRDEKRLMAYECISLINKVLSSHKGPIHEFSAWFPYGCDSQIISDYIDQLLRCLSRDGIKELTLGTDQLCLNTSLDFSSLNLTHLTLSFVSISTPTFGGFAYLTDLELNHVANVDKSIFDCPLLQKLKLITCIELFYTSFIAPNLKCFHETSKVITLARLDNLTEYSFGLSRFLWKNRHNVAEILDCLHKVEKFTMGQSFIAYLAAGGPPAEHFKLHYLKSLNITDINFTRLSEVSCLLSIIRSAPNLCQLNIFSTLYFRGEEPKEVVDENFKKYWAEDSNNYSINHLESVTFSDLKGLNAEMELAKFLLAHSPSLKTMSINHWRYIKKDEAFEIIQEMLQYPRASSRAQVRHMDHAVMLGRVRVLEFKPLLSRNEIMSILHLKTEGPLLREWVEKVLLYQLDNCSRSAKDCIIKWMNKAQSKRARIE